MPFDSVNGMKVVIASFPFAPGQQGGRIASAARSVHSHPGTRARSAFGVIGSSDKVHVVDALAITGDEGRRSVRKAPGSPQTGFDPEMSEWGNPARKGHHWPNP